MDGPQTILDPRNPACGIYADVPAEVYHAIDACSNSRLTTIHERSPMHLRHELDHPEEPTPALVLGDAAHLAILQPHLFDQRYAVAGRCSARKKDDRPCDNPGKHCIGGRWHCGVHVKADRHRAVFDAEVERLVAAGCEVLKRSDFGSVYLRRPDGGKVRVADHAPGYVGHVRMLQEGCESIRVDLPPYGNDDPRTVLSADDHERCMRMTEAAYADPRLGPLLRAAGACEATMLWRDPDTGLLCKLRADKLIPSHSVILDLKTTEDASPAGFTRSIWNFGYHRQGAFYLHGAAAHGQIFDHFVIGAIEKNPPHAVGVYRLTDEAIEAGWRQIGPLMQTYKRCAESGEWCGYGAEITDISLPDWAWGQMAAY